MFGTFGLQDRTVLQHGLAVLLCCLQLEKKVAVRMPSIDLSKTTRHRVNLSSFEFKRSEIC